MYTPPLSGPRVANARARNLRLMGLYDVFKIDTTGAVLEN
jgi:hypothetical protein